MRIRYWTAIALLVALGATVAAWTALAATGSEIAACQKKLETQLGAYSKIISIKLHKCADQVVSCKLADEIDATPPAACLATADTSCALVPTPIAASRTAKRTAMVQKCNVLSLTELKQFIGGLGFENVTAECAALEPPLSPIIVGAPADLVDCLLAITECAAQREVFIRDPRAQDSLTEGGVAAQFPCVAPIPTSTPTATAAPTQTPTP